MNGRAIFGKAPVRWSGRRRWVGLFAALGALSATLVVAATTSASLIPPTASFTLRAGDPILGVATETGKMASIPAKPPSADVELAIDTTGSMATGIADAVSEANAIVTGVQGSVADTQFAVVQFKDSGDSTEYQVEQTMTPNATDVSNALSTLSATGGGDAPEAHNLVFHNSYNPALGGPIGWRSGTRKFVIVISDAQPHGNLSTQGFAGCANVSADPHGLVTSTELAGMAGAERTLLMIHETDVGDSTNLACYQSLASAAFSGGAAVDSGGSGLATAIINLINAAFANVNDLHLEVASASPAPASASWVTLPPALGPVPAPGTYTFGTIGFTVPAATPANTYTIDLVAKADGVDVGHEIVTIIVPAKVLTLAPPPLSLPIGGSQVFTANASDVLGPYVGDTITFTVVGPDPSSSITTTDSAGNATVTVTYSPPNPGTDVVTATDGPLTASSSVTWFNQPPDCSAVVLDITSLWPPNHKLHTITASGATDPDVGDSATLVIDGITQDEPVNGVADGNTSPDGFLSSPLSNKAKVRAERAGMGDGRVYRLHFTATDTHGGTCSGTATVSVPHDKSGAAAVDSAPPSYNSLLP
jgi:hypothetical protein